MAGVPNNFLTQSPYIQSYNYQDIAAGLGFITFYLTQTQKYENSLTKTSFILDTTSIAGASSTGKINGNNTYDFLTSSFNMQRTINGNAYLSGYIYAGTGVQLTANLYEVNTSSLSQGSVILTDSNDDTYTGGTWTTVRTFSNVNSYVWKAESQAYLSGGGGGTGQVRAKFIYYDGNYDYSTTSPSIDYTPTVYSLLNPCPEKYISSVEIQLVRTGDTAHANTDNVYGVSGMVENLIASTVTNPNVTSDSTFTLVLPVSNYKLSKGNKLRLRIVKSGDANGGFSCDPRNAIITKETTKLFLPFKINL